MTPLLIIVTGAPGAGKTTIGRRLARDLCLPFINKDDLKDLMFTHLGWSDRAWSRKVGITAMQILFHVAEQQLSAGYSLVVECNFRPEWDNGRFRGLQERYPHRQIQVLCRAPSDILLQRFKARWDGGSRHPGHVEGDNWEEMESAILQEQIWTLDLDADLIELDTAEVGDIPYDALVERLRPLRPSPTH